MNGWDRIRAHLPNFRPRWMPVIILIALSFFSATSIGMVIVDRFRPAWTLLGQLGAIIAGFLLVAPFFWRRETYRRKWGESAYRNAFGLHILTGVPVIFAAIAHLAYMPGRRVFSGWTSDLVLILGMLVFVPAAMLYMRAVLTLGVDSLVMLYVYFPHEGRVVTSSIYAVIRHPVYAGVMNLGLALALWRGTWYSLAFGVFAPVGLTMWLRLVEEPELIERFGSSYLDYRRTVPAFWPHPRNWGRFIRFLLAGR